MFTLEPRSHASMLCGVYAKRWIRSGMWKHVSSSWIMLELVETLPHLFTVQTQPNNFTLILSGFITTECVFPCVSYHFLSLSCRFLKFCVSTVVLGVKSPRLQTGLPKACHPACQRIWNALSCQVFVEFELLATGCHRLVTRLVMANSKLEELVSPVWKRKLDRLILFKWFQMRKSILRSNQSESRKAQEYSAALVRFDWPQGFHSNVSFQLSQLWHWTD